MAKRTSTKTPKTYNAEATQAAILDAAEQEFAKSGFAAALTEAIAAKSGVTKTMIYYYFENKEGLYIAVLKRAFLERFRMSKSLNFKTLPPAQALEQFLQYFLSAMAKHPHLPAIMVYEALQNQGKYYQQIELLDFLKTLSSILERGVASGVFRPLDPRHTTINIMGAVIYYFCIRDNIKPLWEGKRLLSKEMLTQHQKEAIEFALAGVRA